MGDETFITTVRIPRDLGDEVELIARVEGAPVSEIIRQALTAEVARKRKDKAFQGRLRERLDADAAILERLAAVPSPEPSGDAP